METLANFIASQNKTRPQRLALLGADGSVYSYASLEERVRKMATGLIALGMKREDRVALVLPNGPEMAVCFLAVSSVATCAPLNPAYSFEEFEFYLGDLNARLLVTLPDTAPNALRAAKARGIPIVMLNQFESAAQNNVEWAQADDVALLLHTSGTTAKPKLVPLTHRNLIFSSNNIAQSLQLTAEDCCLDIMPLFHVHGLIGGLCSSLIAGSAVVCPPGFYAAEFFGWMEKFRPTWYTGVPTMHQAILARAHTNGGLPHHQLRFIRSCSSALPPKLMAEMEQVFDVPVIEAYGMTEGSHQIASNPLPPRQRKPGSVGIGVGTEVAVMDEDGQLLPAEATGEIVLRGGGVMRGYEGKANSFTNSWFRSGDQGHMDGEGYIFLTGRIKELINRGGEKISPREIDEALLEHPSVAQAVAFAIPHDTLGEEVGAAIVLRDGTNLSEKEIRNFALGRLAHFKVPAQVVFLHEIPKGPTGKLQRINLAKTLAMKGKQSNHTSRPAHVPPAPGAETILAMIWADVLGAKDVGRDDHFLDLGGDSLGATRIASRIKQAFGVEVSLLDLFGAGTLTEQAKLVESVRP